MTEARMDVPAHAALAVGIEDIEPGHWVAWVLAIPGCYASGPTEQDALAGVPDAWRAETGHDMPGPLRVVERWRGVPAAEDPGFIINATFADDRRPLDAGDPGDPGSPGSPGTTGGSGRL